jgi:predicted nucleic acid-binding protein
MPFLDTSVLIASLDPDEPHHAACDRLVEAGRHQINGHALAETFSVLTGGRASRRLGPAAAARLIQDSLLPYVQVLTLTGRELMTALAACEARGIRGGAVYDWLHLAAARKAGAALFVTLNLRDFQALARPGDPQIQMPGQIAAA